MESKKEIYDLIPAEYYGIVFHCKSGTSVDSVLQEVKKNNLLYPLIAKPDIGMQGKAVKKLEDEGALEQYVLSSHVDFLIQEYIEYENEVGVFYYKYPNERYGHISGIAKKEFLTVCGDGISTILLMIN
ncbi:MAG TPA: hypothetical protein VF939_03330 [Puia sp.]